MFESSLNNALTRGNSAEIAGFSFPDYNSGVTLGVNTYTATENCWVLVNMDSNSYVVELRVNDIFVSAGGGSYANNDQKIFPLKKGDVAKTYNANAGTLISNIRTLFPLKG